MSIILTHEGLKQNLCIASKVTVTSGVVRGERDPDALGTTDYMSFNLPYLIRELLAVKQGRKNLLNFSGMHSDNPHPPTLITPLTVAFKNQMNSLLFFVTHNALSENDQ